MRSTVIIGMLMVLKAYLKELYSLSEECVLSHIRQFILANYRQTQKMLKVGIGKEKRCWRPAGDTAQDHAYLMGPHALRVAAFADF